MSEMVERVAEAARETAQSMGSYFDDYVATEVARSAIEAMQAYLREHNHLFDDCQECSVHSEITAALKPKVTEPVS